MISVILNEPLYRPVSNVMIICYQSGTKFLDKSESRSQGRQQQGSSRGSLAIKGSVITAESELTIPFFTLHTPVGIMDITAL